MTLLLRIPIFTRIPITSIPILILIPNHVLFSEAEALLLGASSQLMMMMIT
jgi:hypothetical protein